jgi:hypothetical protein
MDHADSYDDEHTVRLVVDGIEDTVPEAELTQSGLDTLQHIHCELGLRGVVDGVRIADGRKRSNFRTRFRRPAERRNSGPSNPSPGQEKGPETGRISPRQAKKGSDQIGAKISFKEFGLWFRPSRRPKLVPIAVWALEQAKASRIGSVLRNGRLEFFRAYTDEESQRIS